jgi:hypothetical protein
VLSALGVSEGNMATAWWLALVLGLIVTGPTALSGLIDWLGITWGSPLWRTPTVHLVAMVTATVFFLLAAQIAPAWEEALAADRPCVLDFVTDPEVPPLPPHITFEQAKMFALAVAKGDSGWWAMIEQSFKDKVEEFLPGRG